MKREELHDHLEGFTRFNRLHKGRSPRKTSSSGARHPRTQYPWFPTPGHLASWAGVCPGNHESGGRRKSGKTRDGDHWLTGSLGVAALAAGRSKDTYLTAQYTRLVRRLGNKQKAIVALQHSMLTSIRHMLTNNTEYHDLGSDYYLRRDPDRERRRAVNALNKLGYTVTLNPIQTAA